MKKATPFVQDLIANMPTPGAKAAAISVLAKWAGSTIYLPMDSKSDRRQRAAENMLANGMEASEVANALRHRFGVSIRTAHRDVSSARKMAKGLVSYGGSNGGSETYKGVANGLRNEAI